MATKEKNKLGGLYGQMNVEKCHFYTVSGFLMILITAI